MTDQIKWRIIELRNTGHTYREIAKETELSLGAVKMAFLRSKGKQIVPLCEQCSKELRQSIVRKGRRFCSDKCRVKWWTEHPEQIKAKAEHCFLCNHCGRKFFSRKPGRYCSRACYYASRRSIVSA